jgi:hypothetical protein
MLIELDKIRISQQELEEAIDIDIFTGFAIDFYRAVFRRDRRYIFSFLLTELLISIVVLILITPIFLIILRNFYPINLNNIGSIIGILLFLFGTFCNCYLWYKSKQVKSLVVILQKLEQYKRLIKNLEIINLIENQNENHFTDKNKQDLFNLLLITKTSLLKALKIESIIRKHQKINIDRQSLYTDLEQDLIALISFESRYALSTEDPIANEQQYDRLFNEILELGIGLNKEMRKINTPITQ